jgi:CheY-like chemotaxis protein
MVSDISIAGGDGPALIRHLRATEGPSTRLVAVALTAHARDDDHALALAAGFDAYVSKPVDPGHLIGMIARLTRRDRKTP